MRRERIGKNILTVLFVLISIAYMMPIVVVLFNSFKSNASINTSTFALPNAESFVGWANYQNGMTVGEYPFINSVAYSFVITILSAALILICTSMAAWYISRVDDVFSRVVYYLCVFSMIVPFQMVMFTLAKTANVLDLDTPLDHPGDLSGIWSGTGGIHVHGLCQGHAAGHRRGRRHRRLRTSAHVLLGGVPHAQAIFISVGVLEIMWVWNDYLLPYLVLDRTKYKTIPIHIQYLQGSYGHVDLGAVMALIMISILPIIIFYLTCQKYIVSGVMAGAVKG